jgi:hypothetical protein
MVRISRTLTALGQKFFASNQVFKRFSAAGDMHMGAIDKQLTNARA